MSDSIGPKKELFLEYLFNDAECMGSTRLAADAAGYDSTDHSKLVRELKDEILKRTQEKLVLKAPKAAGQLIDMMEEDGSIPKADLRLKAVESLLDRVGVSKKQEMVVSGSDTTPLFFIPAKQFQEVQDNGTEETN